MVQKLAVIAFVAALTVAAQKETKKPAAPTPPPAKKAAIPAHHERQEARPRPRKYNPFDDVDGPPQRQGGYWDRVTADFEHRTRFSPIWLPGGFLGLPIGGVISQGSRGIDEFFKTPKGASGEVYATSTADAWHEQIERENAMRPPAPPPPPAFHPWEILMAEGKMTDSNGSVGHYGWKIVVRNNTDADLVLSGDVDLVDADGHSVDGSKVTALRIPAHAEQEFSGSKMVMSDSAQSITGPRASLR
jgi:hypothetical protein